MATSQNDSGLRQRKPLTSDDSVSPPFFTRQKSSDAVGFLKFLISLVVLGTGWYAYRFHLKPAVLRLPMFQPPEMLHGTYPNQTVILEADVAKRNAIVKAFQFAWRAYENDAFGDDDYHPISRKGSNLTEDGGIGYFIVDALDTMKIMGLEGEYSRARRWVQEKLSFDRDGSFNTFETTIRVLGGLLSIYHLTGDELYLNKAIDLGDRILPAFDTHLGLPTSNINLGLRQGVEDPDNPGLVSTAEVATLQLEFRYLGHLTDNDIYWTKVERVMQVLKRAETPQKIAPILLSIYNGQYIRSPIRLGSRGDSYYEYLLKQYIQTDQTEVFFKEMYDGSMQGVQDLLFKKSEFSGLTYTQELLPEPQRDGTFKYSLSPKQDHLVCFLGGSLMLGATITGALVSPVSVPPLLSELTPEGKRAWTNGYELIETCMDTHKMETGLSPEIVYFRTSDDGFGEVDQDWYIKGSRPGAPPPYDARYMLRPETVESLFIAFRLTGDIRYRRYGWKIFKAIEKYCKVETGGYATILDVSNKKSGKEDKTETFFLSETLKYLYLLFDDVSTLPLDRYVYNTEGHPLPIFAPSIRSNLS